MIQSEIAWLCVSLQSKSGCFKELGNYCYTNESHNFSSVLKTWNLQWFLLFSFGGMMTETEKITFVLYLPLDIVILLCRLNRDTKTCIWNYFKMGLSEVGCEYVNWIEFKHNYANSFYTFTIPSKKVSLSTTTVITLPTLNLHSTM